MKSERARGRVVWRMNFSCSPETVFAALDSNEGRASFWAESAVENDGQIEFRFVDGTVCRCPVLKRRRARLFSLEYMGSPVRFELTANESGGTDLVLTQENVAPEDWEDVYAGWLNVLFPLKAWVVHGVDLRNHDPARTWDRGYADQ